MYARAWTPAQQSCRFLELCRNGRFCHVLPCGGAGLRNLLLSVVEKLDKMCGLVCQQRMAAKLTTINYEILFSPASKALSWRQVRDQNYIVSPDQSDGENPSFNHSLTLVSAIPLSQAGSMLTTRFIRLA